MWQGEPVSVIDVFADLRLDVDHGRCVLRPVPFDRFDELAALVGRGLFLDGDTTLGEWYDPDDLGRSARRAVAYHAGSLADVEPDRWSLPFGIWTNDTLVGVQSLDAEGFPIRREAFTGSFVAPEWRGKGFGKLARWGVLSAAFVEFDAEWVVSRAVEGNSASTGVSLSVGYVPDGLDVIEHRGAAAVTERFRLSRERWAERRSTAPEVRSTGFDELRRRLGIRT